jgi:hypothetical protein
MFCPLNLRVRRLAIELRWTGLHAIFRGEGEWGRGEGCRKCYTINIKLCWKMGIVFFLTEMADIGCVAMFLLTSFIEPCMCLPG